MTEYRVYWLGGPFDGQEVRANMNLGDVLHIANLKNDQITLVPELADGRWVVRVPDDFEWTWCVVN